MRWLPTVVAVLFVFPLTGCPSEFGKDGRVDKAVHKDMVENVLELSGCSDALRAETCGDGPNKDAKTCKRCGG